MFSWDFPYPSQRMPVLAKNVVATSQPLAAQAGLQMLAQGGNAVDAALAAAITLTVVEPTCNGIGSDAFAILWDGKQLLGLNASGRSPAAWTPERFAGRDAMPVRGWDSVTVPGCVSAWVALSQALRQAALREALRAGASATRARATWSRRSSPLSWARQAPNFKGFSEFAWTFLPQGPRAATPASASTARSRPRRWSRSPRPRRELLSRDARRAHRAGRGQPTTAR